MLRPLDLAKAASAGIFGAVSVLRRGRSLHPNGLAFRCEVQLDPEGPGVRAAALLRRQRTLRGIMRVSRSVGLPETLPDIYGLALRIQDAHGSGRHQDLLFTTGGESAVARHIPFLFARGYRGRTLSTVLPYRIGEQQFVFLARLEDSPRLAGRVRTLEDAGLAARDGALAFELFLAPVLGGRPVRLGRIVAGETLEREEEHDLRFTIDRTGGGIEPAGAINALRPVTYRASQAARVLERPRASGSERRAERTAA
jgi:hypothetical protein